MKTPSICRNCLRSLVMAGLTMLTGAVVQADDIELLVAQQDPALSGLKPNVLIIVDTSGSMWAELVTQEAWNPLENWDGCYTGDSLYVSSDGTLPACESPAQFSKSLNTCEASEQPLAQQGQYRDQTLAWLPDSDNDAQSRWVILENAAVDSQLECLADTGEHGASGGSRLTFPADGAEGPWAGSDIRPPSWPSAVTLFDGNWLNWNQSSASRTRTRMEVVQEVTARLVASLENVNVGMMRFNEEEGGPVIHEVADVETNRASLLKTISEIVPGGKTPLSETLYEAGQYLAGRLVDYGNVGPIFSVPESRLNADPTATAYNAPGLDACQKNYIILLTDGEPVADNSADDKIVNLPQFGTLVGPDCDGEGDGRCLDDMADYLFRRDLQADTPTLENVTTFTVGFNIDLELLNSTAARGGGSYFLADNTSELTAAMSSIFLSIVDDAGQFTAPSVPVNAYNRTESSGDIYVSVFEPATTLHWPGNLKKYRFANGVILDRNGQAVVDPATGIVREDATSFWSSRADGDDATEGGAASLLPDWRTRNVLTNTGNGKLDVSNTAITPEVLGATPEERNDIIQWARGRDVFDENGNGDTLENRQAMGDPLHVRPVTVQYGPEGLDARTVVYVSTNDGYLHAIDAATGVEKWSFVPASLLGNLTRLSRNPESPQRQYGLDSPMTVHIRGNDGMPGISGSEQVILLFGMRRGGRSVFALDVTRPDSGPDVLWIVDGSNPTDPALGDLGQTWSSPMVGRINVGGTVREGAFFGGGYDPGQDATGFRTDAFGNALFILDLTDGSRIWSAGNAETGSDQHDLRLTTMQHGFASPLRLIDLDGDGVTDRIYSADLGGKVWRFDIFNGSAERDLVEGGVLASIGGAENGDLPGAGDVRRFYTTPDVVPVVTDDALFLALNIGSGFRAHPLDTIIEDEFFSVRDYGVFDRLDSDDYGDPINREQLIDVTDNAAPVLPTGNAGWRLRMIQGAGEKVLSDSVTLRNVVLFTSFSPRMPTNACEVAAGVNRLYAVSVVDGRPITNLDSPVDAPLTTEDRSVVLSQGGIAATPTPVWTAENPTEARIIVGTETPELGIETPPVRSYWSENPDPEQ